jgi:hypothetical protein
MLAAMEPNQKDVENAAFRAEVARKQNEQWGKVYGWVLGAFGPGWETFGRHYLVDKVEEDVARKEDWSPVASMTTYCMKV